MARAEKKTVCGSRGTGASTAVKIREIHTDVSATAQ